MEWNKGKMIASTLEVFEYFKAQGDQEAATGDSMDLAAMYYGDAEDARKVISLLEQEQWAEAMKYVAKLDTLPREYYDWYYDPEKYRS